jgi:phosphonate transport system substrate-binding protein
MALVMSISGGAPALAAQEVINFGIISTESSQNLRSVWEPFLQDMEKKTGFKIRAFFANDYAGIVTGMQFNKVQLAWYGNKSAMEAVDRAGGEVFMQTVAAGGVGGYYSHLIAHVDSPLNNEKDLLANAGKLTFGNGDPNSTSGFLVPGYYVFSQNNVDPRRAFKRMLNAGHEANAMAVANKQVDAATSNSEALERLEITNPEKRKQIKVIWTSPLIPSDPLVWRKDLSDGTKAKLVAFFLDYGVNGPDAARELAILEDLQWSGFHVSDNDQLIPIRQLELFKDRNKIAGDANLAQAEKDAKLAVIDAQLAELSARQNQLARSK